MIDAFVTGRSLPALQAALDLAEVGLHVVVAASSGIEGAGVGAGIAGERDESGHIAAFLRRVAEPIEGAQTGAHADATPVFEPVIAPLLCTQQGEWLPQSSPEVLGVPAVPISSETVALIGGTAATLAYVDRIKPLLTVGKTREFGRLVRGRMGATLLNRLVEPQVFERFGVAAEDVDVAIAAPGLNETLSRAGALSSAVLAYSERNVARETRVAPEGGAAALERATLDRLAAYGVELLDSRVVEIVETLDGWSAALENGERIEARALIADQGRSPRAFAPIAELVASLLPQRMRHIVDLRLGRPSWLPAHGAAVGRRGDWAVRIEAGEGETADAVARLSSKVVGNEDAAAQGDAELLRGTVSALTELCGQDAVLAPEWEVLRAELAASPYATMAERERASSTLDALVFGSDTLLPVGRALHGDDLGVALGWAQTEAIALRRRLLGLGAEA